MFCPWQRVPGLAYLPIEQTLDIATNSKLKQPISATDARGQKRIGHSFWTLHRRGRCPPPPPSPDPTAMVAAPAAAGSSASDAPLVALSEYRRVMEGLGRGMAAEAEGAFGLVPLLREELVVEIERRRRLATTDDYAAAAEASQGAAQIVTMISRMVTVITTMSAAGRQLWAMRSGYTRSMGRPLRCGRVSHVRSQAHPRLDGDCLSL
jgi:hypothetical protein